MKIRNKQTGEIVVFGEGVVDLNIIGCKNVAEMIEAGWTDYEEPKEYWYIDWTPEIGVYNKRDVISGYDNRLKEIGNYIETKKEAEKAVEKLKAWKRLKDAGYYFKPDAIEEGLKHNFILRLECEQEKIMKPLGECKSNYRDLKILFGGEE